MVKEIAVLPAPTDPRWQAVLSGQKKVKVKSVPFGLLLSRLTRQYSNNPENLEIYVKEAHSFCTKFRKMLEPDLKALF